MQPRISSKAAELIRDALSAIQLKVIHTVEDKRTSNELVIYISEQAFDLVDELEGVVR